jgi:hypothetical protein
MSTPWTAMLPVTLSLRAYCGLHSRKMLAKFYDATVVAEATVNSNMKPAGGDSLDFKNVKKKVREDCKKTWRIAEHYRTMVELDRHHRLNRRDDGCSCFRLNLSTSTLTRSSRLLSLDSGLIASQAVSQHLLKAIKSHDEREIVTFHDPIKIVNSVTVVDH